jgi:hypothetical protein
MILESKPKRVIFHKSQKTASFGKQCIIVAWLDIGLARQLRRRDNAESYAQGQEMRDLPLVGGLP